MTVPRDAVADYLTIRRALGFKLVEHQRLLGDFVTFLEQVGAATITTELAVAWAVRCRGTEGWKAARLSVIRGFAGYLRTIDPATEIPPTGILIARKHYAVPYLYSQQEIERLLAEAAALRPPLRAATYYTLLGLLAVSGMRIGEALRLDRDDVDLDTGVITIHRTKVREIETAAAAPVDDRRTGSLRPPARRALPETHRALVLSFHPLQQARQERGAIRLSGPAPPRWDRAPAGITPAEVARPQTCLCRADAVGLAPRRRRRASPECCACPPTWGTSNRPTATAT